MTLLLLGLGRDFWLALGRVTIVFFFITYSMCSTGVVACIERCAVFLELVSFLLIPSPINIARTDLVCVVDGVD